jgi:hypothetical protein
LYTELNLDDWNLGSPQPDFLKNNDLARAIDLQNFKKTNTPLPSSDQKTCAEFLKLNFLFA